MTYISSKKFKHFIDNIFYFTSSCRSRSSVTSNADGDTLLTAFNMDKYCSDLSWQQNPMETAEVVYTFLLLWSRLEILKREWGCRRLKITNLNTIKCYEQFQHLYQLEVLQPVYHRIMSSREGEKSSSRRGRTKAMDEEIDVVELPQDVTEYELKVRQLIRLLENFECMMIDDCIRKISRENTAVISERAREDYNLPTDLWKRPSMKENLTIPKDHLVEDFVKDLEISEDSQSSIISIERETMDQSLMKLATSLTNHDKMNFLNCSMFYENILRQQNNLLYFKEQKVKSLEDKLEQQEVKTSIEVDCALAERSYELLVEITALRSKIADLEKSTQEAEEKLERKFRQSYNDMVLDLFHNAFGMKMRFENFRLNLHDEVLHFVQDVSNFSALQNNTKFP